LAGFVIKQFKSDQPVTLWNRKGLKQKTLVFQRVNPAGGKQGLASRVEEDN